VTDITDRKVAEKRFKEWVANLDKVEADAEKTTLAQLLGKFEKTRMGKAEKTRKTERWLIKTLTEGWNYGLDKATVTAANLS